MILPRYHIGPSLIAGAGQGLFLDEPVARGRLITAPDAIPRVYTFDEIHALPHARPAAGNVHCLGNLCARSALGT